MNLRGWVVGAIAVLFAFSIGVLARVLTSSETRSQDPDFATSESTSQPPTSNPTTMVPPTTSAAPSTTSGPTTTQAPTTSAAPEASPEVDVVVQILEQEPPSFAEALSTADLLRPGMILPSDCGLPYHVPASLPNSPRTYRSGTHQGIDFICLERGRDAVAARDGRVVVAVSDYVDPIPSDRAAVLEIASTAGRTPPYTLVMMYGNYVVLDHGVINRVGHVISIYAHLQTIDEAVKVGSVVDAGQRLGEIGNLGTDASARGIDRPQSIHLHWELHVDGVYLGAGLGSAETEEVYRALFESAQ